MTEVRRILRELYSGMVLIMLLFLLIGVFTMRPYWLFAISLIVGTLAGCFRIYHIYDVLDRALDMQAESARKLTIRYSMLRLVMSVALLVLAAWIDWVSFVGVTIGLIAPKICAYFLAYIRKLWEKYDKRKNGDS